MKSLRRVEVQAKVSLIFSLVSLVPLAAGAFQMARHYRSSLRAIQFDKDGLFMPALILCCLATMLLGAVGVALGANSAGERRNDQQRKSWAGFFLGVATASLGLILLAAFWMYKLPLSSG